MSRSLGSPTLSRRVCVCAHTSIHVFRHYIIINVHTFSSIYMYMYIHTIMHVCTCIHTYVCTIPAYIHVHTYICMHNTSIHTYVHTHTPMYICIYTNIPVHAQSHRYASTSVCLCMHLCVCVCVCVLSWYFGFTLASSTFLERPCISSPYGSLLLWSVLLPLLSCSV